MADFNNLTIDDTGFLKVAKGTTAQRPGSPSQGATRFNSTLGILEYYNGNVWVDASGKNGYITSASNYTGSVTTDGDYTVITYNSSSYWQPNTVYGNPVVEFLVIGGGGAGGYEVGGGGGGGGFVEGSFVAIQGQEYQITIGGGMTRRTDGLGHQGTAPSSYIQYSGGPKSGQRVSDTAYAWGGGTGAHTAGNSWQSTTGGSGGGGSNVTYDTARLTARDGASGSALMGSGGGNGNYYGGSTFRQGGGGGGAGRAGYNAVTGNGPVGGGASGGSGDWSKLTGSTQYYAGGGGGGSGNYSSYTSGGTGGGGTGGSGNQGAGNGTANRGGGGGGGGQSSYAAGGSGGSGVVILRYRNK